MSNRKGRCFRSQRRLKRRKDRQAVAVAEMRRRQPQNKMFAQRGFHAGMLSEDSRNDLMRGYGKVGGLMRTLRRGGRRGA